jgi:hypothetical protein
MRTRGSRLGCRPRRPFGCRRTAFVVPADHRRAVSDRVYFSARPWREAPEIARESLGWLKPRGEASRLKPGADRVSRAGTAARARARRSRSASRCRCGVHVFAARRGGRRSRFRRARIVASSQPQIAQRHELEVGLDELRVTAARASARAVRRRSTRAYARSGEEVTAATWSWGRPRRRRSSPASSQERPHSEELY